MSNPILRGAEAYRWAWLRHGPLWPYVRAQTLDLYATQLYPRGVAGWAEGRLTVRAGAWWAQHATTGDLYHSEEMALHQASFDLVPSTCPDCHGVVAARHVVEVCATCFGTGRVHAMQPQPMLRPLL
jgi:hypothetical protein